MGDLRLFYENSGVNYDNLLRRLGNKESLLQRCLVKFIDDQNFSVLADSIEKLDYENMMMAAHTLKGITANLDLVGLCTLTTKIVECIRNEKKEQIPAIFIETKEEYHRVISELKVCFNE